MTNLYFSSEIRWFSYKDEPLRSIFNALPYNLEAPEGQERTDFYLRTSTSTCSIKIREGKHEIKSKHRPDEFIQGIGRIDQWAKWSSAEGRNILNTIGKEFLTDWIPVKKLRFLKSYSISEASGKTQANQGFTPEGCGVEFTELTINQGKVFTFGLEAWGTNNSSKDNLIKVFKELGLSAGLFVGFDCMSYPEYLSQQIS